MPKRNKVEGKAKEAAGTVREETGDLLDNEEMEAEGAAQKWEGRAQGGVGEIEEKFERAADDLKDED